MTQQLTMQDHELISQIAKRACEKFAEAGIVRQLIDCIMDIEFTHIEVDLRLDDLLAADDANFNHDVFGIAKHMNRDTKKLEDGFIPRYAS